MIRSSSRILAALAALAAIAGCSIKRVPAGDPARSSGTTTAPASSGPYDFQKERPSPPAPTETTAPPTLETPQAADFGSPAVQVQDLPAQAPSPSPAPAQPSDAGAPNATGGFRVQVFASTDADAAERARADVESRLGLPAYLRFESPYHKVRVGNCATTDECQRLQETLRTAGFTTLWVVPDTIQR
jgi:cell division protein FtsN